MGVGLTLTVLAGCVVLGSGIWREYGVICRPVRSPRSETQGVVDQRAKDPQLDLAAAMLRDVRVNRPKVGCCIAPLGVFEYLLHHIGEVFEAECAERMCCHDEMCCM